MLGVAPVLWVSLGCTWTTTIGQTADTEVPDTDTAVSTDSAPPTDTAGPGCALAVPDQVSLSSPVHERPGVTFQVPSSAWALSVLQASRLLDGQDDLDLRLSPSWFLAAALESTGLGCFDYGDPYVLDEGTFLDGCLAVNAGQWDEVCGLYPEVFDCEAVDHDSTLSTAPSDDSWDHLEPAAMTLTWSQVAAYAQLSRWTSADVDSWFAAASDPLALEKVMALVHAFSSWEPELADVMADCQDAAVEDCLAAPSGVRDHVVAVASHLTDLQDAVDQGACYDEVLTATGLQAYVEHLAVLWPDLDVDAASSAAVAALEGSPGPGFQQAGGAVVDAVYAHLGRTLSCPDQQLQRWYGLACP